MQLHIGWEMLPEGEAQRKFRCPLNTRIEQTLQLQRKRDSTIRDVGQDPLEDRPFVWAPLAS